MIRHSFSAARFASLAKPASPETACAEISADVVDERHEGAGVCGSSSRVGDVTFDGSLQIDDAGEGAALEPAARERGEKALDGIKPGG